MKTENQKILNNDISRYSKNKAGANLALLGLVFNCLYFMLLYGYKSQKTRFDAIHIGISVLLTLVTLLVAFLSSEGVKGYNKKYCIVLLVLAAFQIFRIFGYPLYGLKNKLLTVNYFGLEPTTKGVNEIEFTILLVYLCASAACFIISAVISYIRSTQREKYLASIESGEFDADAFIKKINEEEDAKEAAAYEAAKAAAAKEANGAIGPMVVNKGESKFTGGAFGNFFRNLAVVLGSICTLGIAYPFLRCWYIKWKVQRTYINGNRLTFDGKGGELFRKYIIWLLLSIVTFGIYYIVKMSINLVAWETKHTHVEGAESIESSFDGRWYQLLGVKLLTGLVTVITLSFGYYWAYCYKQRWFAKHKCISGARLVFTGKGIQFFGKCIVWELLTIVTVGIYSFWLTVKVMKWGAKHTEFVDMPQTVITAKEGD